MAITINTTTDIDVVCKQRALVTEALGPDSAYIKMKNTLEDLLDDGEMKNPDRAKVVAETIANMAVSITNSAMGTGLQWAAQEKELELKKLELQYQLDILDQQRALAENQVADSLAGRQLKQAQRIREYGTATTDADGNVVLLADNGKVYREELNVVQDTANKTTLNTQIQAQTDEVQARTHRTIADTYVNHGIFTWTDIGANGLSGVVQTATGYTTLSDLQKHTAVEQAKGYTYNAWSNAASSSSGMLGTLIAAEIPDMDSATLASYITSWKTSVDNLGGLTVPAISV